MKAFIFFICLCLFLLVNACRIEIRGLISGHKRAQKEAPILMQSIKNPPPLCTATYQTDRPLQVVTAQELSSCLKDEAQAIVYEWSAHCPSDGCYLPDVLQAWCVDKNVDLYIMAEYYDYGSIKKPYQLNRPIIIIDHQYYETVWVASYFRKFQKELLGRKRDGKTEWGRLLYFENGRFQGFYNRLEDLPLSSNTVSN